MLTRRLAVAVGLSLAAGCTSGTSLPGSSAPSTLASPVLVTVADSVTVPRWLPACVSTSWLHLAGVGSAYAPRRTVGQVVTAVDSVNGGFHTRVPVVALAGPAAVRGARVAGLSDRAGPEWVVAVTGFDEPTGYQVAAGASPGSLPPMHTRWVLVDDATGRPTVSSVCAVGLARVPRAFQSDPVDLLRPGRSTLRVPVTATFAATRARVTLPADVDRYVTLRVVSHTPRFQDTGGRRFMLLDVDVTAVRKPYRSFVLWVTPLVA